MNDKAQAAMDLAVKEALERAFKLGATEGAKQVVKLEAKLAEVTAERDEFVKSTKRLANSIDDERALTSAARRARDHFEAALAASQAHAVELRAALKRRGCRRCQHLFTTSEQNSMCLAQDGSGGVFCECKEDHRHDERTRAALARESSTDALCEFGLRVADECLRQASASSLVDGLAAVDAVLRGDHE